jgi:hypothetical protein
MIILGPNAETFYSDGERVEYIIIDGDDAYVLFRATADKPKHVKHFVLDEEPKGDCGRGKR